MPTETADDISQLSLNARGLPHFTTQDLLKHREWVKLIEPHLPVELRGPHAPGSTLDTIEDTQISDLADIIQRAGLQNVDVVGLLGLHQGRWEAVQWIVKELLQHVGTPRSRTGLEHVTSNLVWPLDTRGTWPVTMKLDAITQGGTACVDVEEVRPQLDRSLDLVVDTMMSPPSSIGHTILGEIWIMLGNMIIAATGQKPEENVVTMSNVLRIIASLHHHGWIPEAVYRYNPNSDPSALQQPPLLYDLSSTMLSSLSEAVYLGDPEARSAVPARSYASSRLFTRTANKIPDLGPELWLEFCLWCCVHGGWTKQGVKILLAVLSAEQGAKSWSLICWRDILESPEEKWEEYAQRRLQASQGADKGVTNKRLIVERTLSAEVIVAVIDGLISGMPIADEASSIVDATATIEKLKGLLDRDRMSLGVSSWDSVIQRIADSPNLNIESNPRTMETILSFAETFGHEIDSANAPGRNGSKTSDKFAAYVFDASATVLGLYHRTLHAYIRGRTVSGALRVLGRLQTLTDANKLRSMEDFFSELHAVPEDAKDETDSVYHNRAFFQSIFPGVQYPGFFPNIPLNILADLLDLLTEVGNTDVARWMLYSEDIDGPLIPESAYNDQLIAPALVRYAAANSDSALLKKVTQAQSTDISGPTLVAICQARIRQGDFPGAVEVLDLIKQYTLHRWRVDESASLIRALLPLVFGEAGVEVKPSPDAVAKASQFMRQLLRGEHGIYWGKFDVQILRAESQIDTVLALLSDISPEVADVFAGLLREDNYRQVDMTTPTFNTLLAGVVQSFGARAAQRLCESWCRNPEELHRIRLSNMPASEEEPDRRPSPAERFGTDPQDESEVGVAVFKGSIRHDISTISVIIGPALESTNLRMAENPSKTTETTTLEAEKETTETEPHQPVLSTEHDELITWAIEVLRADFNMNSSDIDYVTQGYFPARNNGSTTTIVGTEQPYSATTLRLWQAFTDKRRLWAQAQEQRLRAFAANTANHHTMFLRSPPAERQLVQSLARDYGLLVQTFGEGSVRDVKVWKPRGKQGLVQLPVRLIDELLRMRASPTGWRLGEELSESSI